MPFKDLREFIARLEKEGEALRIEEEVDWNLEAGAMLRRAAELGSPAPFFQNIKGFQGYRMFGGGAAKFCRMAIALDMPRDSHPREIIEQFSLRKRNKIKPVLVKDGPCKENIHIGDAADLLEFPVPLIHEGDGGRYLGTWHITVTRDLASEWVNWGTYRHMLHSKNSLGIIYSSPAKHMSVMFTRGYQPKNMPMEVAIAIGVEPVSQFCATYYAPYGVSEAEIAGGIRGEPVELIKCETVNLHVPAAAEIVIEGEMRPGDIQDEGPYGEYSGYRAALKEPRPVIRVKAITHRNNPILTFSCGGVPVHDDAIMSMTKASSILDSLRERGIPTTGVSMFPEAASILVTVAVKATYPHIAEDVAHVIWGDHAGHTTPYVIVVEDDVDPFSLSEVIHALVTKCHPHNGIVRLENSPLAGIFPFLSRKERESQTGAKVYFDCTFPRDWDPSDVPQRISFKQAYPADIREKVNAKWRKYGYE